MVDLFLFYSPSSAQHFGSGPILSLFLLTLSCGLCPSPSVDKWPSRLLGLTYPSPSEAGKAPQNQLWLA